MKYIHKKRIQRVIVFALIAAFLGGNFGYISTFLDSSTGKLISNTTIGIILGLVLGLSFGILEEFTWRTLSKKVSYWPFSFIRFFTNIFLIIFWLAVVIGAQNMLVNNTSFKEGFFYYFTNDNVLRDIVLAAITAIISTQILKIRRLHNTNEFISLMSGKYHYPEKEERVVLFADLSGSTTLAEKLPPIIYSQFIKDCFSDISEAILAWEGELYQHVGDGVVVTWKKKKNTEGMKAINCYFSMIRLINKRKQYYLNTYNVQPIFRCGIHEGSLVTTWVGEAKRELAFHGDAINTAARIQSLCKDYQRDCLVSSTLISNLTLQENYEYDDLGKTLLRGKNQSINLISITEK